MHTLEQLRSGQLAGTRRLDLSAGLTEFPREIFSLADTLEVLNLSGNALTSLPADLGRLHRLQILFCSDNQFTAVPECLGQCTELRMVGFKANRIRTLPAAALPPQLRWLILTDNQLEALPAEIGNCLHLQKLMLAGNRLRELPTSLARCTNLELLRLSANLLPALPGWLLTLPRLSWLAYGGNPCADALEAATVARHPIGTIAWDSLSVQQQLGEGASGVIYQAQWAPGTVALPRQVAVKLFKGAVTSDGLPRSEMAAGISAGQHPNLIGAEGKISGHPHGAQGLVLTLFDPVYRNLAGPPSFASCTRDEYASTAHFPLATALRIARGVAAATAQLHARGLLHGDLYAHNIVTTPAGDCLLGDFGAASFFDPADLALAPALTRLETRAFGCLLEELLARCPDTDAAAFPVLQNLRDQCLQPEVLARPAFTDILTTLQHAQQLTGHP